MTRPTKHPRTNIYRVRIRIPAPLRAIAKERFGQSAEFIESLGTKDSALAKDRAPAALGRLRSRLASVQALHRGEAPALSERKVMELAGQWYRVEAAKYSDHPGSAARWEADETDLLDRLETKGDPSLGPDHWEQVLVLTEADRREAALLIASEGLPATTGAIERVGCAIWDARRLLILAMSRRVDGDWSEDETPKAFPLPHSAPPNIEVTEGTKGCSFETLLSVWAMDRGWTLGVRPVPRPLYDRIRTLERFAAFVGHHNADVVTKADAVRWKEEMQGRSLSATTIQNDISEMSAIWKGGMRNGKLRVQVNPFSGILPPNSKHPKIVRGFTDAEAGRILCAARNETGFLRWLPWVLCLTGARLQEVCQANRDDVAMVDGILTLSIHGDGAGMTVKNAASKRTIPLHPALLAEGFQGYVESLAEGPLWPDIPLDTQFGLRSTFGGKSLRRWIRKTVGIKDEEISPNHSWRHRFITECRKIVMPPEVRSAITGHRGKTDESAGYGEGMQTMVQVMAQYLNKVPAPLCV